MQDFFHQQYGYLENLTRTRWTPHQPDSPEVNHWFLRLLHLCLWSRILLLKLSVDEWNIHLCHWKKKLFMSHVHASPPCWRLIIVLNFFNNPTVGNVAKTGKFMENSFGFFPGFSWYTAFEFTDETRDSSEVGIDEHPNFHPQVSF